VRREYLFFGALLAVAALYVASRSKRGEVAAADAVEFVTVTAQRIANEAWRVSLGLRNRNPGNIDFIANPLQRWRGMKSTPGEGGRFGEFDTDANGVRAIGKELQLEERRGAHTVRQQIEVWAPSSENDVAAYAKSVAKSIGFGVDEQIPRLDLVLPEFVAGIIKVENGVQPYTLDDIAKWVFS
jgi:hypothetical protein